MDLSNHLLIQQIFTECQLCAINSDQGTVPGLTSSQMGATQPYRRAVLLQCDDNSNRGPQRLCVHTTSGGIIEGV